MQAYEASIGWAAEQREAAERRGDMRGALCFGYVESGLRTEAARQKALLENDFQEAAELRKLAKYAWTMAENHLRDEPQDVHRVNWRYRDELDSGKSPSTEGEAVADLDGAPIEHELPETAQEVLSHAMSLLTPAEREIAGARIGSQLKRNECADMLGCSVRTADKHTETVRRKLENYGAFMGRLFFARRIVREADMMETGREWTDDDRDALEIAISLLPKRSQAEIARAYFGRQIGLSALPTYVGSSLELVLRTLKEIRAVWNIGDSTPDLLAMPDNAAILADVYRSGINSTHRPALAVELIYRSFNLLTPTARRVVELHLLQGRSAANTARMAHLSDEAFDGVMAEIANVWCLAHDRQAVSVMYA